MPIKKEDLGNLTEPEVAEAIVEEVNALGENTKKIYENMRNEYEELKVTVDKLSEDTLEVEKFHKLGEAITIRVEDLDKKAIEQQKKNTERMDAIEVALKRPGRSAGGADDDKVLQEAKDFAVHVLSAGRKGDEGVAWDEVEAKRGEATAEHYMQYRKAFEGYIRRYGGSNQRMQPEPELKALQVGIDPDGGITVPVAMSNRITQIIYETDPIRQLAAVESITTGKMEWMAEWDEAGYEWEGEATGETTMPSESATPTFKKMAISVHSVYARPRVTQTLLEDSGINIEQWLAQKVADKFSRAEAAAFVSGNGIGRPKGFLTYSNGTTFGTIEQIAMGASDSLTADGFLAIKYGMKEYFIERGTWLMNRSTVLASLKLKYGDGNYIWNPGQFGSGNTTASILGLPVKMSTTIPEVATNALAVVLADWKEAYLIVDRLGITVQRDPYTVRPFIEFYTRKRVGGGVNNWEAIKIGKISA